MLFKLDVMNYFVRVCLLILCGCCMSCGAAKNFTYLEEQSRNEKYAIKHEPYIARTGDNLYISVLSSNAEMNKMYNPATTNYSSNQAQFEGLATQAVNGFIIDSSGSISLPLLGEISVAGLTIMGIEQRIKSVAGQFLKDVTVKVRLLNFRYSVSGEVKSPGIFYNYGQNINIIEAIAMANGVSDFAKLSNVMVIREDGNGSQLYKIDLNSSKALQSDAYYLRPRDIVIVQPAKNKNINLKSPVVTVIFSSISSILLLLNFLK